ncbi:FecR family protein [Sphingomonas japonica]|uniref:Transmembrane sensor n=1 Tax=Sphingomonas japonica TaxID=511662 RepID=A0ABX0TZ83_9SPHN|nr:FecR domain-containing protein [Sphingomonas japonica]NIJ22477.1 transmembrane sensor [Sphingomonas japonica]
MTDPYRDPIRAAARDWAMRVADPAFADWEAFADWLEADPQHNVAYEAALAADAEIAAWFVAAPPRPILAQPTVRRPRRLIWGGGAVAAGLAVVLGWSALDAGSDPYAIETAPGQRRQIALSDGSRIDLNGGSRIVLDDDSPRLAALERGEALFTVRHDAADPFVVTAGPSRLVDVGTVFNVVRTDRSTRVTVSEGAVVYNPDSEAVRLDPGKALFADDAAANVRVSAVAPEAVGAWTARRLVYSGTAIEDVAADLARNLGVAIAVEGAGTAPFTGTIAIDGDPAAILDRTAPLLGLSAQRKGEGWVLTSRNRVRP